MTEPRDSSREGSRAWREIVRDLRRSPAPDDAAIDRVMAEVRQTAMEPPGDAARRRGPHVRVEREPFGRPRSPVTRFGQWFVRPSFTVAPAHLLAAMLVLGVGLTLYRPPVRPRAARRPVASVGPVAGGPAGAGTATAVSQRPATDGTHEVRFVLVADSATAVAVAGDFNDWNHTVTPMRREGGGNVWSVTLRLPPGRHLYAFVVDDSTWVSDVTAPRAPEDEFGGASSVLFVSRQS